ncbi:hypothetical protein JCM5296_007224 [Sporobolomyces johnsonii]
MQSSRLIRDTIVGGTKEWQSPLKCATPLPFPAIDYTVKSALSNPRISFDDLTAITLATVAFLTCALAAEVTMPITVRYRDATKFLHRDEVVLGLGTFRIHLRTSKTDRGWAGGWLRGHSDFANLAWITLFRWYLAERDQHFPTSPFLFLRQSGLVPTRMWFVSELRRLFGPAYTGHSLRSGRATYFTTVKRWPPDIIKCHGRWSSDAWEAYVRVSPDIATALTLAA